MHQLNRTAVPRPTCLDYYDWNTQTWKNLKEQDKKTVLLALQRIQGQQIAGNEANDEEASVISLRCAYCESPIFSGGHIEHFRRKHPLHFPELTFEWTNLFIACGSQEHCGHYKDRSSAAEYDPDDLVKPDDHNPDDYLYFHSSGGVRVRDRDGMTDDDRLRGAETIRVFHLDCGRLKGARRKALETYLDKSNRILEDLMDFDENDRHLYMALEIEATKWDPFWTTIRHFFEKYHV